MICRLCLSDLNIENSIPLYDFTDNIDQPKLFKSIKTYLNLNIEWNDEISTTICLECSSHLNAFDEYYSFIREQQIMLSQRVPVVDEQKDGTANLEVEACCKAIEEVGIKTEPDVTNQEVEQTHVTDEIDLTLQAQLKCEPEETQLAEIRLMSDNSWNHLHEFEDCSSSSYQENTSDGFHQLTTTCKIEDSNTSYDHISSDKQSPITPDAKYIKLLPPIQEISHKLSLGMTLDDNDRTIIAEAVVEESLKNKTEKVLNWKDLMRLAGNIVEVFPSEEVSTYYLWHTPSRTASGTLFLAYNKNVDIEFSIESIEGDKRNGMEMQLNSSSEDGFHRNTETKLRPTTSSERVQKHRAKMRQLKLMNKSLSGDLKGLSAMEFVKTKTKTKKKAMSSTERSRLHRLRQHYVTYHTKIGLSSVASIDDTSCKKK